MTGYIGAQPGGYIAFQHPQLIERRAVFFAGSAARALALAAGAADKSLVLIDATGLLAAVDTHIPRAGMGWLSFASWQASKFTDASTDLSPLVTIECNLGFLGSTLSESWQGNFTPSANAGISGATASTPIMDGVAAMTMSISSDGGAFVSGLAYLVSTFYVR